VAVRDEIRVDGLPPGVAAPAQPTTTELPGEASDWEVPQARPAGAPPHQPSPPPAGVVQPPPEPQAVPAVEGPPLVLIVGVVDGDRVLGEEAGALVVPFDTRARADGGDPGALAHVANMLLQHVSLIENPPLPQDVTRPCVCSVTDDTEPPRITVAPRTWSEGAQMWSLPLDPSPVVVAMARELAPVVEGRVNAGERADEVLGEVQRLLDAAASALPRDEA
jgi:hypothetical protein